ncbi:hypothetical protein RB977_003633 [Vibrio harveyi]|nr:hypothetical protein [Vibrio harveyi]
MDHVRLIRTELSYAAYTYEHHLVIPSYDLDQLQDVRLQFWGEPSQIHTTYGIYPNDIRLYIGGIDVTPLVIEEVVNKLIHHSSSRQEYVDGMAKKLNLAQQMGDAYGNTDINEESAIVDQLSNVEDISTLISQFGEYPNYGWGGAFHPFNYLFKTILIQPISLAAIIAKHNSQNPEKELSPLDTGSIQFTTGTLGTLPNPVNGSAGRVVVLAELRYHNTLRDRLVELEKEIASLREQILLELESISDAVGSNGDLAAAVADLEGEVQAVRDDLGDSATELASQSQQLSAIKSSVAELKAAVLRL